MISKNSIGIDWVGNKDGSVSYTANLLLRTGMSVSAQEKHDPRAIDHVTKGLIYGIERMVFDEAKAAVHRCYWDVIRALGPPTLFNPVEQSLKVREAFDDLLKIGFSDDEADENARQAKYPGWVLVDLQRQGFLSEGDVEILMRKTVYERGFR